MDKRVKLEITIHAPLWLTTRRFWLGATLCLLGSSGVLAAVSKPHAFSAGETILAAEMNENFDTIYDAFNARVIESDLTINVPTTSRTSRRR